MMMLFSRERLIQECGDQDETQNQDETEKCGEPDETLFG
jgi:hypothetical protein